MKQTGTRDHLISTGLKLLHARGFHACGVQDITEAAEVPKGTFYTHFDSKERFGADVLGRYWEQRASRAQTILSDESRSPLERLKAYFASKAQVTGPFDKGCMIGNFSAEMAQDSRLVRDRLGAVFAAWTQMLATCIREAQAAGELRPELDPDTIAAFLIDAFEGAVLRTKVDRDATALKRFEAIVFSVILT
ncbi:MAG TPA: TetR family transcriptional regulator [Acetobacteraceae bacterium]|jgi:TetR/AcrR family transcriptional regulator, transcriptional repressor for nem operon|nr:TetR family transcriptional regulator [Acetobacteraceae bacterium]